MSAGSRGRVALQIERFRPEHMPAVRQLADAAYRRPRENAFQRWAFLEGPTHRAWVAMQDDSCVGLLRAFARTYRFGDDRVGCLETFDWYVDPVHRRSAVGVRILRAAMEESEPLVNVGGSPDTLALLPALGWRTLDRATSFALPLDGSALPPEVRRRLGRLEGVGRAALTAAGRTWFRPVRRFRPRGGAVLAVGVPGEEVLDLYQGCTGYGLLPLPDIAHLRWLAGGHPASGQFICLYFTLGGVLRGWGLVRVVGGPDGPEAALVETYAPRPTYDLYRWMVAELVAAVLPYRPRLVRARASCPVLGAALRKARFLRGRDWPVFVWSSPPPAAPPGPCHLTLNTQDEPLIPVPERWFPESVRGAVEPL